MATSKQKLWMTIGGLAIATTAGVIIFKAIKKRQLGDKWTGKGKGGQMGGTAGSSSPIGKTVMVGDAGYTNVRCSTGVITGYQRWVLERMYDSEKVIQANRIYQAKSGTIGTVLSVVQKDGYNWYRVKFPRAVKASGVLCIKAQASWTMGYVRSDVVRLA